MKNSTGIKKIAIKVNKLDANPLSYLLKSCSGAKKLIVEPGLSAYHLADGTTVEVYGAGAHHPDYLFAYGNVVMYYKVPDIEITLAEMCGKGAILLGQVEKVCTGYKYCHLLIEAQTVIGLYQE